MGVRRLSYQNKTKNSDIMTLFLTIAVALVLFCLFLRVDELEDRNRELEDKLDMFNADLRALRDRLERLRRKVENPDEA